MSGTTIKPSITIELLRSYFGVVKDLRTYLSEILEPLSHADNPILSQVSDIDPKDTDSPGYKSLLNTTYVAFNPEAQSAVRPPFKVFSARSYKDGDKGKQGLARVGITNIFVNTIVTALQAPEWDLLLRRETSIFVSLPNGCLCQMTGDPIIYAVPKKLSNSANTTQAMTQVVSEKRPFPFNDEKRPTKRLRSEPTTHTSTAQQCAPIK
ncbi:hypothetical protein DXG03_001666 [Asterophora parasitica]|uniref:Telomerase reverse transcriptase n=1 Tax=Asterophora parasitica TaxID=117018 RepID=A0A9P7GBD2_9AGAR|nr:hypothetical protein DXG03_001666 [Asterophora parasitica]